MHISISFYLFSNNTVLVIGYFGGSIILAIGLYFRE